VEAARSLIGINAYPFFIPSDSKWSGAPVARLLSGHGIGIWDIGYANGEMFFRVRKNQAAWAQYVMRRAGVPLTHRLFAGEQPNNMPPRDGQTMNGRPPKQGRSFASTLLDGIDSLLD
jgi:hypothetical protein